ncbi:hypothetical protein N9878_00620 [bacterium]|nr:hypothetical protein [bacterium]
MSDSRIDEYFDDEGHLKVSTPTETIIAWRTPCERTIKVLIKNQAKYLEMLKPEVVGVPV